ncbi:hypothetical protein CBL_12125 [Carabus blaptoides fortunei]
MEFRHHFQHLRPVIHSYHGNRQTFAFENLGSTDQVFVHHDGPKAIQRKIQKLYIRIPNICRQHSGHKCYKHYRLKPAFITIEEAIPSRSQTKKEEIKTTSATNLENPMLDSELHFTHEANTCATQNTICSDIQVRFPDRIQVM